MALAQTRFPHLTEMLPESVYLSTGMPVTRILSGDRALRPNYQGLTRQAGGRIHLEECMLQVRARRNRILLRTNLVDLSKWLLLFNSCIFFLLV
jgi:hypothetical protein